MLCYDRVNLFLSVWTPGLYPSRGHCTEFLLKTLNFRSAFFHPGVQLGTSTIMLKRGNPVMDWHCIPDNYKYSQVKILKSGLGCLAII